ncbi:MAG TPA: hypothetical protein VLA61_10845 [Ideonella sp.]|uniref:hypothetical protein n=1 Tax=Ideonella sp. TaxID=1929293 RepID=UPI002D060896|nr:hypothetical protein [Ideonella sp.]HSI48759.1 hypothetical protein [Ideonella sp.]
MAGAVDWLWLPLGALSGTAFYLGTTHQRLRPAWRPSAAAGHAWRLAGLLLFALSAALAIPSLGRWPGVFCALSMLMLACVALPWLDQGLRDSPAKRLAAAKATTELPHVG